jgi:F-type H+-transporting ATPase subunit delta
MAKLVSTTYGDALFELAVEEQSLDSMLEEVRTVAEALRENEDLTTLMNHPKIDKENKIQLIEDIFKGQVSDELVGLIRMIVEKDHYKELPEVFAYFIDRVKEYRNIGTAYVTSAMELSDAQKAAVEKRLLDTTKYVQFEMHYQVDAGLIGGMVIRIGDRVVDSSIKTRIYDLTRELSQIQLKVGECAP